MVDRPIIFSGPMVRAILGGQKTMTRRLAWRDPEIENKKRPSMWLLVKPGDRLWVREAFTTFNDGSRAVPKHVPMFAADYNGFNKPERDWNWTPPIHMPRAASRLTLEVTAVKIERLQEISGEDAEAEGVRCDMSAWTFVRHFQDLWERLHGPDSWKANPEIVAISFTAPPVQDTPAGTPSQKD